MAHTARDPVILRDPREPARPVIRDPPRSAGLKGAGGSRLATALYCCHMCALVADRNFGQTDSLAPTIGQGCDACGWSQEGPVQQGTAPP